MSCNQCLPGYFGNDCSTYCIDQPEYKCDTNGIKVCTMGWSGSNCSSCDSNYYGLNCDVLCVPQSGVYWCDTNGTVRCVGNRAGVACTGCQQVNTLFSF